MKYDVFISYRREGGYDTAKHLNDLLVRDGYRVSFDIDTLRNGDFDVQLLSRIEECKDFILIVDEHAFDRTLDPTFDPKKDWVRCELAHALKLNKNIIPVFLNGITEFPENLPEDVVGVVKKNGPEYSKFYFNVFYKKLRSEFLTAKSRRRRIMPYVAAAILLVIFYFIAFPNSRYVSTYYLELHAPKFTTAEAFTEYLQELNNDFVERETIRIGEEEFYDGINAFLGLNGETDYKTAIRIWKLAAKYDIPEAHYALGVCYANGLGTGKNYRKAKKCFEIADLLGDIRATNDLGICYVYGYGVRIDHMTAFELFKQASEEELPTAQYNLATCYINAMGCQVDIEEGVNMLRKASYQDYALAQYNLADYYAKINEMDMAILWLEKASDLGFPLAQYQLGNLYLFGYGVVDVDLEKGIEYLQMAADKGDLMAIHDLALCYWKGMGVDHPDEQKYKELITEAAERGWAISQYSVGNNYEFGTGGFKKNKLKSLIWYRRAARQGYTTNVAQQNSQQAMKTILQNN